MRSARSITALRDRTTNQRSERNRHVSPVSQGRCRRTRRRSRGGGGPERTRDLARHEDRSRKLVDSLIIAATFLSLVLVVVALLRSQQKDPVGSAAAILAVVGVVAAWALINTVYAFKYARMYYLDDRHRFDFDQDEDPSYSDFAYTAFSIGMAYSASNVTQSSTPSRRIALAHALLSYFFGTFVVAVAINLITGLTQGG
jgi:uncharacterized membrane protein